MSSKLFINDYEIGTVVNATIPNIIESEPIILCKEMKCETAQINYANIRKFFRLPRKLKKKTLGLKRDHNKLLKRIRLNLPISLKDLIRAGVEITRQRRSNGKR